MSYLGRLAPEVLRKRYAKLHQMLQAAGTRIVKLQERIEMLEAENRVLKEERDAVR